MVIVLKKYLVMVVNMKKVVFHMMNALICSVFLREILAFNLGQTGYFTDVEKARLDLFAIILVICMLYNIGKAYFEVKNHN